MEKLIGVSQGGLEEWIQMKLHLFQYIDEMFRSNNQLEVEREETI